MNTVTFCVNLFVFVKTIDLMLKIIVDDVINPIAGVAKKHSSPKMHLTSPYLTLWSVFLWQGRGVDFGTPCTHRCSLSLNIRIIFEK